MNTDLKAIESPIEILRALNTAASPAPWKPNCVHETEGDGAWGAGPLCEPSTPEEIKQCEDGDWDMDAQMALADEDAALIATLRNLAPELIALWEAAKNAMELGPNHQLRPFREEQLDAALLTLENKARAEFA